MRQNSWVVAAAVSMFLLPACVQKGPVLLEGVTYEAPEGTKAGTSKVVVGVGLFKDERGKTTSVLGKRTSGEVENDLVVQGNIADLVAAALKDALKARGITARDVPAGDLAAGDIKADGANVILGGEIKSLWVDAVSQPLNAQVTGVVQLRVHAADAAEKKVFRTLVLNSKVERHDIVFSYDLVSSALSEALSGAINQLMNDDEFKRHIQ